MDNITGLKKCPLSFTYVIGLKPSVNEQENAGLQKDPPWLYVKSKPDLGWVVFRAFGTHCDNVRAKGIFTEVSFWPACHYPSVLLSHHFLCLCGAYREAGLPFLTKRE